MATMFTRWKLIYSRGSLFWGYLVIVALAESMTSFVNASLGFLLHVLLLFALLIHSTVGRSLPERGFALALMLAPLLRLFSLSLPFADFPRLVWYPLVAVPLLISTWFIIRQLRLSRAQLGLRPGQLSLQLMVMCGGFGLGAAEYAILAPAPLPIFSWGGMVLAALILIVFTGITEELIFRGVLQAVALPALGRWGLVYISLVFAALHIGYGSVLDVIFVFGVGLLFAYIVRWSGSLLGVSMAHGLTNVMLFLIIPHTVQGNAGLMSWPVWVGSCVALVAVATLAVREIRSRGTQPPVPAPAEAPPGKSSVVVAVCLTILIIMAFSFNGDTRALLPELEPTAPSLAGRPDSSASEEADLVTPTSAVSHETTAPSVPTTEAVAGLAASPTLATIAPATTSNPGVAPATTTRTPPTTQAPVTVTPISKILQQVAAAEAALRSGQFEATMDYGDGSRAAAMVRFNFGGEQQAPQLHMISDYQSPSGKQTVERVAIGERTWNREPDGQWSAQPTHEGITTQVRAFLPNIVSVTGVEVITQADASILRWYDANRDSDVTLVVDSATGAPRELRRVGRSRSTELVVSYHLWNIPVEIRPPQGN